MNGFIRLASAALFRGWSVQASVFEGTHSSDQSAVLLSCFHIVQLNTALVVRTVCLVKLFVRSIGCGKPCSSSVNSPMVSWVKKILNLLSLRCILMYSHVSCL